MAVDKLVDSTQLNSDLTSVANAIRTKGGTSAQLAFPTDFVSAINAISGGGGIPQGDYVSIGAALVTVGANSITKSTDLATYLLTLANVGTPDMWAYFIVDAPTPYNNLSYGSDINSSVNVSIIYGSSSRKFWRYNNGTIASKPEGSSYDAVANEGTKYVVVWFTQGAWS